MRVQDFRHFLPAIGGVRPQTTFRRPRVRVFTPAAVLAPVAIPSFFPPEVLDLTHPLPFPVRSASRPGKTRYAADFPHRHGNPPAVPQQQRFTVLPAGPVSLSSRQVSTRAYRPIRGYRRRSPDSTVSLLSNRCRDMSLSTPPRYSRCRCSPRWRTV